MVSTARRLADLLIDPHETLDVEHKEWIDIVGNNDHKAVLAKALIALANHGGGFVIFGFSETQDGLAVMPQRPQNLAAYTPDTVNAIAIAYADPPFHCDVNIVVGPDGLQYPIVSVPGGHHVPIKAKRDGPNGQIVKQNSYYIRRPGPQSETPQNGREWDTLIRRCIANARSEMLDQIRGILQGNVGATVPEETELSATIRWLDESLVRWAQVISNTPPENSVRLAGGHFAVAYSLRGNLNHVSMPQLLEALHRSQIRHTGWPLFLVPTRSGIVPYPHEATIECWIGRDGVDPGPAHSDFWRASPDGRLFSIRGYQEDDPERGGGTGHPTFDITLPAWRVGEALLHAANMAREFGDPAAQVTIITEWTGLAGRTITSLDRTRLVFDDRRAQQNEFRSNLTVQADQISDTLPELVVRLITPLYELFDFFRLPGSLPAQELARMRANRF